MTQEGATIPDIELLLKLSEIYGIAINDILKADASKISFQKNIVFPDEAKKAKRVFVIGCGRWGTFIAWYLDKIGHKVSLYGRECSDNMKELLATRKNNYLSLSDTIHLTTSYEDMEKADYIVISVGAQHLQSVVSDMTLNQVEDSREQRMLKRTGTDDIVFEKVPLRQIKAEHYNQAKSYIERIQTIIPGYAARKTISIREQLNLV